MQRRHLLAGLGVLITTPVAGCLGDDENNEGEGLSTDAVRGYFEALADGDRDRANQFAHPEGDYYIDDDDDPFLTAQNLSITETETVDIDTAVRSMFENPEEVQLDEVIDQEQAAIEEVQDTHGFTDYEYVRHDATSDGLSFNSIHLLFEDNGWVIWSVPTFHRNR